MLDVFLFNIFCEVVGGRTDAVTYDGYLRLQANLAQLSPDANHDLQRAAHTAYWQAALQLLGERAEQVGLNADHLLKTEAIADFLNKLSAPLQKALSPADQTASLKKLAHSFRGRIQSLPRLLRPAERLRIAPAVAEAQWRDYECRWLEHAILQCWALLADIQAGKIELPTALADDELKLLFMRGDDHKRAQALRDNMTQRMQSDLRERFAWLGQPSDELEQLFAARWYDYFRGAFHTFVKNDQRVANMLTNLTLAEILCGLQDGVFTGAALTPEQLRDALAQQTTAFTSRFDRVEAQLAALPETLRPMLTPLALATANVEQFFTAIHSQLHFVIQQNEQTHRKLDHIAVKVDGLARDRQAALPPSAPREVEENYLEWLQKELAPTEVYTKLSGDVERTREIPSIRSLFKHFHQAEAAPPVVQEFEDAIPVISRLRRIVLLGDPGSGKSFTLAKLAADLAAAALGNKHEPIPLFIRLGGWVEAKQSLPDYIAEYLAASVRDVETNCDLSQHVGVLLAQGRAALVLDGLNEFPPDQRTNKYAEVRQFITEHARRNKQLLAAVSCRELDYRDVDLKFDRIVITPLDPLRIREFATKYLDEKRGADLFWKLAGEQTREYHTDFIAKVGAQDETSFWRDEQLPTGKRWNWYDGESDDADQYSRWPAWLKLRATPSSLMQLASNPYLLTMLTEVFEERGDLPNNRGGLFRQFVTRLMERENISRDDQQSLLSGLTKVARTMQMRADDEGNATTILSLPETKSTLGERLLRLAQSASLLSVSDPVRFTHQLLQEYFAALWMDTKFRTDKLPAAKLWKPDRWWHRNNWEEAAILLAGLYDDDCTPVINWLADANPELAAQCVERSGARVADATLERLREKWLPRLTDVQTDPEPQARAAIGRALGQLNLDHRKGVALTSEGFPDIDWVEIPGGEFDYGDDDKEAYRQVWPPAKAQRLTLPTFWMSRYPVTNAQFQAFVEHLTKHNDAARWFEGLAASEDEWRIEQPYFNFSNHPRERVSWYQAMAFCRWLSSKMGGGTDLKRVNQWAVRLPTEVEWERAARGTTGLVYSFGNEFNAAMGNVHDTGIGQTAAVGIFPKGDLQQEDVKDLTGNVWEWCLSEYRKPEVKPKTEARKENLATDKPRVLRGGSWIDFIDNARAAARNNNHPANRNNNIGFRLVVSRPPS